MCHLCAILNGIAGIIVFSAPSAVSAAWFPPEERTTATGVAIVFNNLGNAVSFLAAPAIVPDPPSKTNVTHAGGEDGAYDPVGMQLLHTWAVGEGSGNNTTTGCPDIDPDVKTHIWHRVDVLMYLGES